MLFQISSSKTHKQGEGDNLQDIAVYERLERIGRDKACNRLPKAGNLCAFLNVVYMNCSIRQGGHFNAASRLEKLTGGKAKCHGDCRSNPVVAKG